MFLCLFVLCLFVLCLFVCLFVCSFVSLNLCIVLIVYLIHCKQQFDGHTGSVWSVGYSPDGKFIVSGSWDKSIRIWSISSGEMIKKVNDYC